LLVLYQGTTSVVPQTEQTEERALAPEGRFLGFLPSCWLPHRRQPGDVAGLLLLGAGVVVFVTEFWRDSEGRGTMLGGALNGPQCAAILLVVAGGLALLEHKKPVEG
jgi:prolipoprotein diacylglyceryltransferase